MYEEADDNFKFNSELVSSFKLPKVFTMIKNLFLSVLAASISICSYAQTNISDYQFEKKIEVPGTGWWDYLQIDTLHHRLFVSHGDEVNVIDVRTEKPVGVISGLEGVHGIAIADELNKGFISNGKGNSVTVFDLSTLKKITSIPVTGKDPDCILYDRFSGQVFTFNGESGNSTMINARTLKVIGTIDLGGAPEFAVSDGKGRIYNNIEDKNEIVVIDTKTGKIKSRYSIAPSGKASGMAIDIRHERLFTTCRNDNKMVVVDGLTGKVIESLPIGSGADGARYDPETNLIFVSCGRDGVVTIIHEDSPDSYHIVQTLQTEKGARTMELNPINRKIYLSVGKRPSSDTDRGSFAVLVYKM